MNQELVRAISSGVVWLWNDAHATKTYDYFLSTLERLVRSVYDGNLGGEFIIIMEDLILGQVSQAYEQAWIDEGNELPVPEYLRDASQAAVLEQYGYVEDYYRAIVDARVDGTGIDPLLSRAQLWANQWNTSYNDAILKITAAEGGNLVWRLGATEEHCSSCSTLNGMVARASEWERLGVQPQGKMLECGGWRCLCTLEPTDKRRSPKAFETIMNAITK